MSYGSKVVSVTTAATPLAPGVYPVTVQNLSAVIVYLGGPAVTADTTATGGLQLPASVLTPVVVPRSASYGGGGSDEQLYARVASGTANVAVLT